MSEPKNDNLSASLEDYLEAIYNLSTESKVARSKEIAELLGVSKSSVTGALHVLKKKGLVNYKPYDCITLTEFGQDAAVEVARRHGILKSFFVNILGVETEVAQQAACKAEHNLGPQIFKRLLFFIEFVTQSNDSGYNLAEEFRKSCNKRLQDEGGRVIPEVPSARTETEPKQAGPLSKIKAGETVILAGIDAGRDMKSRLASMGLVSNVEIKVVQNSHPGPFVISVKNSKMMLGRGMAEKIRVL